MAQDFGDDVGDMLLRNITRYSEKAIGLILNEYFKSAIRDWQQAKLEEEGMSKEEAAIKAEVMASREHICMPFGNSTDAAYFAQVVRENGTYAAAMTDDNGNGYVQFAKDDLQKVRECTVQFSEVMTNLKCGEISELIANGKPVTQDVFKSLKPIKNLPDLPNVDGIELNLRDVTLIPVAIRFTDTPDKVEVRTFSEQDTADLDMDSEVFFSGYTHDELTDMVGKATGEDFIVESVGEPYQVKARIIEQESHAADFPEQTYDDRVIQMAQENREAYIAWLREKLEDYCNDDGSYEVYWDYDDSITPDQLVEEVFGNPDNAFIHSIREEIDENSSEAMSELCALVRMDAREMLALIGKRSEAKGSLVLPRDCATMGIFNQWSGCGGVLDILLEKDAVMPLSMIRGFQIEGQSDPEGYTVNDVYGLVGSCWKPAQLSDDIETDVKEDYALALQKARATDWEIEEQEAAEPVSLKSAAKEARAASEALAAHGAPTVDLEHEAEDARKASEALSCTHDDH